VGGEVDSVVGPAGSGGIGGADALRTVAGAAHRLPCACPLVGQTRAVELVEAGAQDLQRLGLVLVLRLLVLLDDDEAGGKVGDADRAVGGVDRLAAGAGRAVDVDAQILVVDLDVDLFRLREHRDGRGGGVDAAPALGDGDALDAVDAAFDLQFGEHALAGDRG